MTEVMSGNCENISTLDSPRNVLEAPAWLDLDYLLDVTHYCIESEGIESAPTRGIRGGMREADDCVGGWLPDEHSDVSHSPQRLLPVHILEDLRNSDEVFRRDELPIRFSGERSSSPGPLAVTVGSPNRFGVSEEEESPALTPRLVKTVENCAAPKPSLDSRFRELLRKVTVNEDDLLRAIERLGGGEKGMKAVLEYIMYCQVLKEHNAAVFDPESFARGLEQLCILKGQALPTEDSNLASSRLGNSVARSYCSTPDLETQPGVSGAPFVPWQPNFSKWHLQTQEDWYRNYHHLDACRMGYMESPPAMGAMYPSFYCAYPPAFAGYAPLNPCVHPVFLPVMGGPTIPGNPVINVQGAANVRAARRSRIARHRGNSTAPPRQTVHAGQATTEGRAERVSNPVLSGSGQSKPQVQPDLVFTTSSQGQRRDGLVFLLHKELKPSDVSSLGRTVLPKKEAETHLPYLAIREGISLAMEDFDTGQSWPFRYRFWPNNKSRMYLLENTRDFVKAHNLQERDLLLLYRNAGGNYVVRGEKYAPKDEAKLKDLVISATSGSREEEALHGEDQGKRRKL